jgi:inosose dehydratase
LKVTFHTGAWGTDHLFQAMDAIRGTGLHNVEVYADVATVYHDKADEFSFFVKKAGLHLAGAYGGGVFTDADFREADVEGARNAARWLKEAGGTVLILQGGDRSSEDNTDLQVAAATANKIGQACLDEGIQFCYQPHAGTCVFEEAEIRAFFAMANPVLVGMCADTGHLSEAGLDPAAVIEEFAQRIRVVHLRDVRKKPYFVGGPFANAGDGTSDLVGIVDVLKSSDYEGWVVGFSDDARKDPAEGARAFAGFATDTLGLQLGT